MKKIEIVFLLFTMIACNYSKINTESYSCENRCNLLNDSIFAKDSLYSDQILVFCNNPFEFDTTNIVRITLSFRTIYIGPFKECINVRVPVRFINDYSVPYLEVQDGNRIFYWGDNKDFPTFFGKCLDEKNEICKLRAFIRIAFLPDKPYPYNILFLPQHERYFL